MPVEPPLYRRADLPVGQRVADLLGRMTLVEMIDQLHQCGIGDTNPNNLAARAGECRPTYGSFIIGGPWDTVLAVRNAFQQRAVTGSRLGIPAIFASDVIHGYRTITPIPLAQACSWNPDLVRRGCTQAAEEAKAHGIDWIYAPMVDHCVDARWGRIAETFGESPHAAAVFAAAAVCGFQGEKFGGPGSVAACLKHYVGYGASEGGRDYVYTGISPQALWEMHLPPFEAGIRAGARTVMSAFNDLNGVPTSANHHTLTEILRHRWGLTGPVVSDWASVAQLINQGFAADGAAAAEKSLNAGVDIDMSSGLYREHLPADVALRVEPGCSIQGAADDDLAPALAAAREADLVILCLGEEGWMSGENASRSTLRLAGRQAELAQAVAATGRPVVLILVSGRPLELQALEEKMSAIIAAWGGGTRAAAALVDTLLGRRNPSGRLAVTWPRTAGQIPLYHNMRARARPGSEGAYRDMPVTPLYEFGHGLGYTTFSYSPLRLDRTEVKAGGQLLAEVTVTNTGAREGVETVFWFIRDPAASITRPLKELKHFEQASLAAGANRVFRFVIEPMRDLSFPDGDGRRMLEPGEIILTAGGSSATFRIVR